MKRLLLLSNSTNYGSGYLDHAIAEIRELFKGVARIAFVPFALHDQAAYTAKARVRLEAEGFGVDQVTPDAAGLERVGAAQAVFVGGGNTFRLLDRLQRSGILDVLRGRVLAGVPYLGASAGTNVAAPTIKTTNDMPIVQPPSFEALGLVPFQINPHYLDADPASTHMGETRSDRLREYLEENEAPVVAMREGAWLSVSGDEITLGGSNGARLFRRGHAPEQIVSGARVEWRSPSDGLTIEAVAGAGTVRMRVRVDAGSRLLDGHFPGEPIVPGMAHLHVVLEGVRRLAGRPMRLTELNGFRLRRTLPPGDECSVDVSRGPETDSFTFEVRTAEGVASSGTLRAVSLG